MNKNFFTEKTAGHVGFENGNSSGTIIDNLSDYSEDKNYSNRQNNEGIPESWQEKFIRVPKEFLDKFPNMTEEKAKKHYNTYLSSLRAVILKRLPYLTSNHIHLSLNKLWEERFYYENNKFYIYKEFKDLRPFFHVIDEKKGNGRKSGNPFERNSEVYIMNQKTIDLLIDTSDIKELINIYYGDLKIDNVDDMDLVPVDIISLTNYITNTEREIEKTERNSKKELILYRNLRQAKYIKLISEFFYSAYDKYVLPQIPKPSPYGRVYYRGINVQNITKEVRAAVLGNHYIYDLNAAVYAIKLMMAKNILNKNGINEYGHFTYTKEYLDWKAPLRKQLSKHIKAYPDGERLIKDAITAIGFGARIGGGSWIVDGEWYTTSIEDIIMNKDDRKNFMEDPWIKQFVKEQQVMTKIISQDFIESKDFVDSVINVPNMFKNNRIRATQVMSYVFQHTEKQIMDMITQDIPVIARVHDSFITKTKLSIDHITNIKYMLKKLDDRMTIDCEEFHGWFDVEKLDNEDDIDEQFSKLTGVKHTKPNLKIEYKQTKQTEGFYDSSTDYGQTEYDHENDPYIDGMTPEELKEHYRIVGYHELDNLDFLRIYG